MSVAEKMTAIADAIRNKTGKTDKLSLDEMATEISEISTGERDINPEWTDWQYFSYKNNRNELVAKLKYSDTSNGKLFRNMFSNCTELTAIPEIDVSKATDASSMFYKCESLVEIPRLNFQTKYTVNLGSMFQDCKALKTIHCINMSGNISYVNPFRGCTSLENITIEGMLAHNCGYSFQDCSLLTHDSLISILNALRDMTTTTVTDAKLTIGSTNLAKLTAEDIAIAEDKGWTLA